MKTDELNSYQRNKRLYYKWCKEYNNLKIPIAYHYLLYNHLGLTQSQARIFHFFAWNCNDKDTQFKAAQFRGIAGIDKRDNIPDFLDEFKNRLVQFNVHYRKHYWDKEQKKSSPYSLEIGVDDITLNDVDYLADWEDGVFVPLSEEPVELPKFKRKRKATTDNETNAVEVPDALYDENSPHMLDLINYLHSKKVSYNIGALAKKNRIDLNGQTKIIYRPKLRTDRFFSDGKIANDKYLRQELYHGCYCIDINNAQLSIIAALWNLPKITTFLQTGKKIWDELIEFSGFEKSILKDFLYSAIFGMKEANLKYLYDSKLLDHELIKELIDARDEEIQRILDGKKLTTAFGDILGAQDLGQARSIIATQVQSYEQSLILHAFQDCIRDSKDAVMVLYLNDGFFLKFSHNEKFAMKLIERIKDSMSNKGGEFGMYITCSHELVVDDFRID